MPWPRKRGFIVPWESWVRDPRNATLERLLAGEALAARGLFDLGRLRLLRQRLCAGDRGADAGLFFQIAVLGLWLEGLPSARAVPR